MQQGKNRKDSGRGKSKNSQGKDFGKGRWKKDHHSAKEKNTQNKPKGGSKSISDGIRLNKYIANSGVCSRREADMYIQVGSVTVNGKIINEMGYKVKLTDEVTFD